MKLQTGQMLLHYRIVAKLGAGGMGVVYVAEDTKLQRRVAIKVLPAELADDPDRRTRFEREARAVAALNHPNIVTLHSVEQAGEAEGSSGALFLTMELVEGQGLDRAIPPEGMALDRFFDIALPLADALGRAHGRGIVHRDVKSANIVLTDAGAPKILDFGLAKVVHETAGQEADRTTTVDPSAMETEIATKAGAVLGTPAYMSPEQALGRPADARSDVFSLGTVMYEMLSGERPFKRDSQDASMQALLRDEPDSIVSRNKGVPRDVAAILNRCLSKDPEQRYPSGAELHADLEKSRDRHLRATAGVDSLLRQRIVVAPLLVVVVAVLALVFWSSRRTAEERRLRKEVIPRIETLLEQRKGFEALELALETREALPDDPAVEKLVLAASVPLTLTSEPSGAKVWVEDYRDANDDWLYLCETPCEARVPAIQLVFRVELDGHDPLRVAQPGGWGEMHFTLVPTGAGPEGMLRVDAGVGGAPGGGAIELPAHWIDRHEVTNRQYQQFVDAGGYQDPRYWVEPFEEGERTFTFEQAMERFVDATGRPGPASWQLSQFPEGMGDYPVGGVSWYEAAAYARWAGKSLPTFHHWLQDGGRNSPFADILVTSNFDSDGPQPVTRERGLGPFGTIDTAGNVREWCYNRVGNRRYAMGGSYDDPPYAFSDDDALDPFDRPPTLGFRCVQYEEEPPSAAFDPIENTRFDFAEIEPMSDELFELVAERYDYEPRDLDARLESTDESSPYWRRESVSFTAAYGGERMLAHLFLPTNATPPFQTVIYRPGSTVNWIADIDDFSVYIPRYLPRSGRAVVVPALYGTLERQVSGPTPERVLRQVQDVRRTVDYLATRPDIDIDRLAYVGLSAGGEYGPCYAAMESRFKAAIFLAGGYHDQHMLDEPRDQVPWNFAPRVTIPTLMVNTDNDFSLPIDLAQNPMFEDLGTPDENKKHVIVSGGHIPLDQTPVIRETLDWLDQYLGAVETRASRSIAQTGQ